MLRHYARTAAFDQLVSELESARAQRHAYSRRDGDVELWCYTPKGVYERGWTPAQWERWFTDVVRSQLLVTA